MRALRRSSAATATVAAADWVIASARTPPLVFPRRRRAGRRPRAVATDAPRGTPCQGAMCALRSSATAAATVAAADQVTASARMPPLVFPCRRRAGRRPRAVATAAPRGTSSQGAMHALRSSTSAAATVAAPGLATASARTLPPVFPKPSPRGPPPASRRDRRPARNAQPGRNARIARLDVGRRHRRGARPGHRQRSNTAPNRPAQSPRWAGPLLRPRPGPSRNTQPGAPLALRTIADGGRHRRGPQPRHCSAYHSVLDPPCALAPSRRLPNPRTGAGFPHNHRSPRFIRFPQPTPLWKTARSRRSCDVDPSQRRSGPVDMWKTCVA